MDRSAEIGRKSTGAGVSSLAGEGDTELAHGLAEPGVGCVGVHAWVPGHDIAEAADLGRGLEEAYGGIGRCSLHEAARHCGDVVCPRNAADGGLVVGKLHGDFSLIPLSGERLIGNHLDAGLDGDADVFRLDVLADGESALVGTLCIHGAKKIFVVDHLALQGWRDLDDTGRHGEIDSTVRELVVDAGVPGQEVNADLLCAGQDIATKQRSKDGGGVVGRGDAEGGLFGGGIEAGTTEEAIKLGQHDFEFAEEALALRGELVAGCSAYEEIIVEHVTKTLQGATDSRLAKEQALGGAGNVALFGENGEDDEEVEIGLAKLRYTHI
jgi:hypothetical protein